MTTLLRVLGVLCALTTAAHFLRFGTLWETVPVLLAIPAFFIPRFLPRPLLALAAAGGALLWASHAMELASWRIGLGLPWLRLAFILGGVCLAHIVTTWLLLGRIGSKIFGPVRGTDWARTAIFLLTGAALLLARAKTPFTVLLGERFWPGSGMFWVALFATYSSAVGGWLLGGSAATVRGRIWTLFSAVFFVQLLLGLAGWEIFLMTGALHLPVPALIISGPLFRGEGLFMPILLAVSLLLVGPAWCSHLCYIGAWDDRLTRLHRGRPQALSAWAPRLRTALLILAILAPLALRLLDVSWTWALLAAAVFGVLGVVVMALYSRTSGTMVHCTLWCPIGLLNNLVGRVLPWRVRIADSCTRCGLCSTACRFNALTKRDLEAGRPGLSCALCGDCLPRCPHAHLGYRFPGLSPQTARLVFVTLVASLHAVFLAVARI